MEASSSSTSSGASSDPDHLRRLPSRPEMLPDRRWVIVLSAMVMNAIGFLRKPMEITGSVLEFLLNLVSANGGFLTLARNAFLGRVVVPRKGSDEYFSFIGHLDQRLDLYRRDSFDDANTFARSGVDVALMDLCVMSSKLAYENANVVSNIVANRWKMHYVDFYNCWNEYQKENSTQTFILCDKAKDANLVLISFRGTEPFDADDWITDIDYSWHEIPKMGRVHAGFLEALGLGTRSDPSSFSSYLQSSNTLDATQVEKITAYDTLRSMLHVLLGEHKRAKFVVTGHSMGGALAILFPAVLLFHKEDEMMERLLGIYTFGQPRVGDQQLEKYMEAHVSHPIAKYYRMVYCNDVVPRLPYDDSTFLFKHFGNCLYYDSFYHEKDTKEVPNRNFFGMKYLAQPYINAVWELIRSLISSYLYGQDYKEGWLAVGFRVVGLIFPGLSAHSTINYINCIRLGRSA